MTEKKNYHDFERIINPAQIPCYDGWKDTTCNLWVRIRYKGGVLSISGVEGPKNNGDCLGSCGQCGIDDHAMPTKNYTESDLEKLRQVWRDWHSNNLRPYSPEMKALGWHNQAKQDIICYGFVGTRDMLDARTAARDAAIAALVAGQSFTPTAEQTAAAAAPSAVTRWAYPDEGIPDAPKGYKLAKPNAIYPPRAKRKALGWVRPSEHPDGLLGRKVNPDDEHGYGGRWWHEPVPRDVLAWLESLFERPASDAVRSWFK